MIMLAVGVGAVVLALIVRVWRVWSEIHDVVMSDNWRGEQLRARRGENEVVQ